MKTRQGDLIQLALAGEFDVIVHGCNCHCQMGRGIALTIKEQLPEAYVADCQTPKSDKSKLGTISFAEIKRDEIQFIVVNAPSVVRQVDSFSLDCNITLICSSCIASSQDLRMKAYEYSSVLGRIVTRLFV